MSLASAFRFRMGFFRCRCHVLGWRGGFGGPLATHGALRNQLLALGISRDQEQREGKSEDDGSQMKALAVQGGDDLEDQHHEAVEDAGPNPGDGSRRIDRGDDQPDTKHRGRRGTMRAHLFENFEYHAAKNEQGMMEARIKELEAIIKNHVLIVRTAANGVVGMGSTVRFSESGEDEECYRIVGPTEADPKAGRVSHESAL